VLGPVLDKDSSASVQIAAKLLKGEFSGLPRFGYAVVDVRDLADLEVRAMTPPQAAGQRYIGSGPFIADYLRGCGAGRCFCGEGEVAGRRFMP
jgi:dihydroflavonol-4-reductase